MHSRIKQDLFYIVTSHTAVVLEPWRFWTSPIQAVRTTITGTSSILKQPGGVERMPERLSSSFASILISKKIPLASQ